MPASRGQEIHRFPRLFESLLNNFDQDLVTQFVQENCLPDCTYELNLYYGEDSAMSADPSQPSCSPKKSYSFNNQNIVKLLEHIHSSIPDVIMFIHDSQFLSKQSGTHLVCKFSISGYAIFDSDMDVQSSNLASSPKHFQQLHQASTSIQYSIQASTSNKSISSSSADTTTNSTKRGAISFKGDITSHSAYNDSARRKYRNTVGKYVNSKHLDNAFEAIKKSKDGNCIKSRKLSLEHASSSNISIGISLDQPDNYRLRSMSVDTVDSAYGGRITSSHISRGISVSVDQDMYSLDQQEATTPDLHGSTDTHKLSPTPNMGFFRNESLPPITSSFSDDQILDGQDYLSPMSYGLFPNDKSFSRSNPEHISASASFSANPFSFVSASPSSASVDAMPSLFLSAPRNVESGGILKVWVPDETNKIGSVVITAYCTTPNPQSPMPPVSVPGPAPSSIPINHYSNNAF